MDSDREPSIGWNFGTGRPTVGWRRTGRDRSNTRSLSGSSTMPNDEGLSVEVAGPIAAVWGGFMILRAALNTRDGDEAKKQRNRAEKERARADEAEEGRRNAENDVSIARQNLESGIQPEREITPDQIQKARAEAGFDPNRTHIAVCGRAGCGKTSLVNAFRGMGEDHPDAAPTGTEETTQKIMRYEKGSHVWYDMPGAGTVKVRDWNYFYQHKLFIYDYVLVVHGDRFSELDTEVLKSCQKHNTKALIIRSKSDDFIRVKMQKVTEAEARKDHITRSKNAVQQGLRDAGLENLAAEDSIFLVCKYALCDIAATGSTSLTDIHEMELLNRLQVKIPDPQNSQN